MPDDLKELKKTCTYSYQQSTHLETFSGSAECQWERMILKVIRESKITTIIKMKVDFLSIVHWKKNYKALKKNHFHPKIFYTLNYH